MLKFTILRITSPGKFSETCSEHNTAHTKQKNRKKKKVDLHQPDKNKILTLREVSVQTVNLCTAGISLANKY